MPSDIQRNTRTATTTHAEDQSGLNSGVVLLLILRWSEIWGGLNSGVVLILRWS